MCAHNTRLPCWPERLAALIEARRSHGFVWGAHDCVTLAADAVLAMTGADPLAAYRGTYDTEEQAERIIGPDGLEAFVARLLDEFGAREVRPAYARRGDWAIVNIGNQALCGVVLAGDVVVPGADRLQFVPQRRAVRAWGI
jgi:hypothetical protein